MKNIHVELCNYAYRSKPDTPVEFLKQVAELVCKYLQVDYGLIFERGKKAEVVECRKITAWIIVKLCPSIRSREVGIFFKSDRTNMYHYINTVNDWRETNTDYAQKVEDIFQFVKQKFV